MIELNQLMQDCIIQANNDYPDLNYIDTVVEAITSYVHIIGEPIEMENEEEGEKFLNDAVRFLIDCVLFNLVEKGMVEVVGMEGEELVFKLSETIN